MTETPSWTHSTLIIVYSRSGNTRKIANIIKDRTSGTIYELNSETDYSGKLGYMKGIWHCGSVRPATNVGDLPDLSQFDRVFIGGPVWMYTMCPPIAALLRDVDFSGKIIHPFCSDGGNAKQYLQKFAAAAPNATVTQGISISAVEKLPEERLASIVDDWLIQINSLNT